MIMKEVCKDVQTEPVLLPTEAELRNGANMAERARLDISARGVFGMKERTFFDVRITHPNAKYNQGKTMEQVYHHQEMEKKRMYNDRIIQMTVCHLFIFLKYRVCSFLLYSVMFCNREFSVH